MTDTQQTNAALIAEAHEIAGQLRERASGEFSSNHEWYLSIAHTLSGLITALEASEAKVAALQAAADGMAEALKPFASSVKYHLIDDGKTVIEERPNPQQVALTTYQQVRGE